MAQIIEFSRQDPKAIMVLEVILAAHVVCALAYLIPKWVLRKPLAIRPGYLFYTLLAPLLPVMDVMRPTLLEAKMA